MTKVKQDRWAAAAKTARRNRGWRVRSFGVRCTLMTDGPMARSTEHDLAKVVLLVEDDADIREAIAEILTDHGVSVVTASNGAEALSTLRSAASIPRLILLDLMMPIMDGWQFRQEQRHDAQLASIPVVVLTAHGNASETAKTMEANGFLKKPLHLDSLLAVVERFCAS
jgi:CheY-like chemotaxis protein